MQLFERAQQDVPALRLGFARGEYRPLNDWMKERLHTHGRKFKPSEMIQRITGGPISVAPYVNYLKTKFGEIYGL